MHKGVLNRNIKHESPLLPLVFLPALMSDDLVTNRFILSCLFKECKEDNEVDTLPLTYLLLSIGLERNGCISSNKFVAFSMVVALQWDLVTTSVDELGFLYQQILDNEDIFLLPSTLFL